MTSPEWLTKRDCSLKPGLRDFITLVMMGDQPQYRVEVRPAGGHFAASVTQTTSGKRLDDPKLNYPDADAALAGGLEQLREQLGW